MQEPADITSDPSLKGIQKEMKEKKSKPAQRMEALIRGTLQELLKNFRLSPKSCVCFLEDHIQNLHKS